MIAQVSQGCPSSTLFPVTVKTSVSNSRGKLLTILKVDDRIPDVVLIHDLDVVFQDPLVGASLSQPYEESVRAESLALLGAGHLVDWGVLRVCSH